jgi:nucleotide-binding universal stress UspA family protein
MTDIIVVGVDDSRGARAALAWAAHQADLTKSSLRIVHAFDLNIAWIDYADPELPKWEHRAHEQARATLERIVDGVLNPSQRSSAELRTVIGPAADALHQQALDASLLVVGSRGVGGFASLLLGSVGQRLAQYAPCPIVIIPPPVDERADPNAS